MPARARKKIAEEVIPGLSSPLRRRSGAHRRDGSGRKPQKVTSVNTTVGTHTGGDNVVLCGLGVAVVELSESQAVEGLRPVADATPTSPKASR